MIRHALLIVLVFAAGVISAETIRLSDPVAADSVSETFGKPLDETLPKMALRDLVENADDLLAARVLVETRVSKVCQKKGCFFIASDEDLAVRVSFRDYGFFVPTDTGNKAVTLEGTLIERELSQQQAEHFTSDLNEEESALRAGVVYEIVADGVRIPRTLDR